MTDICKQVADVLIIKFNKINVKFEIENNFNLETKDSSDKYLVWMKIIN